jgi:hypothetical protein
MALEHKDRSRFIETKVWGTKHRIYESRTCIVDRLFIKSGGYSSLHYHNTKWNRFYVEVGKLLVFIEGKGNYIVGPEDKYKILDLRPIIPHQFRALTDVICTEICYNPESDLVYDEDITRLTIGGLKENV